jgi:hypothetical protein
MYEIEFSEEELLLLDSIGEFEKFINTLFEEHDLCSIDEMYEFYLSYGWFEHCIVLLKLKNWINNG